MSRIEWSIPRIFKFIPRALMQSIPDCKMEKFIQIKAKQ